MNKHTRNRHRSAVVASGLAFCILAAASAVADCGSIPFSAPLEGFSTIVLDLGNARGPDVKVDPLKVVVYEPGQRAIVLWNGEEEILLLSTELKTSQPISILEVIPLPSEPTVKLGDFDAFQKMQRLVLDKTMWRVASGRGVPGVKAPESAARITFHDRMGAHDLAVVQVLDNRYFTTWVTEFLSGKGAKEVEIRPDFLQIIDNYLNRGFKWFAFDVIQAANATQSRQPIEYRFKSDSVFYPLEISSLETGKTVVDLLVVTRAKLDSYPVVQASMKQFPQFTATRDDIAAVSREWADMMAAPVFTLQQIRITGKLDKMKTDFLAR